MQAALDLDGADAFGRIRPAALITASQVNTKADVLFHRAYTNTDAQSVSVSATYTASNGSLGSTIQVNGSGSITTDFMKVAGFPNLNFNTSSTTAWGNVRMRVAMALDNTGSMAEDGKIGALQTAESRQESRRRLYFDHSVRQGRQRRLQQLQPELDRLDRLAESRADALPPMRPSATIRRPGPRFARSPTAAVFFAERFGEWQRDINEQRQERGSRERHTFAQASITTPTHFTTVAGKARRPVTPKCSARGLELQLPSAGQRQPG